MGVPDDIQTSTVCYVNLSWRQYRPHHAINDYVQKKVSKKYPYPIEILKDSDNTSGCEYRIYLKKYRGVFESTRMVDTPFEYNNGLSMKTEKGLKMEQDGFFLFLKDTSTGENYKINEELLLPVEVFDYFIEEVKK